MFIRIFAVLWFGFLLTIILSTAWKILFAGHFAAVLLSLITWPGILAIPFALGLLIAGVGVIFFFGGMIVMALRDKGGPQ